MDLTDMTFEERYAMMRKRHAFLHEIATQYSSLEAFANERDEWFAVRGIELTLCEKYISLYIQLDYTEYIAILCHPWQRRSLDYKRGDYVAG